MYFSSKSDCNSWIVEERSETSVSFFCVLTVLIVKPSETKREEYQKLIVDHSRKNKDKYQNVPLMLTLI